MIIKGKMEKIDTICGIDIMSVDNNRHEDTDISEKKKDNSITHTEAEFDKDTKDNIDVQNTAETHDDNSKKSTSSLRNMHF